MTEIVELPDGRLASYQVAGRGIPALMFPGVTDAYTRQHSALFPYVLRSYAIDLPGSGHPARQVRSYELARSSLGLGRVVVFGHSSGSVAALTYAAAYPEHTTACVAVAPALEARPVLRRVACRTLVVSGELDLSSGPAQARPISEEIPGSEFVALPDCGRLPAMEAPDGYRQIVLDFLRGPLC
jgi:pimeloyl-ACP methyl ester carboxylesterase